ncbi:folylpolyglutamate synthase, mitochondrial-like isoform X1 [Haliotis rufescens]|uniref:folylpolyglutamate synthase, mitochondrial-like isoform X1 n=1 Tax=Haliotis rufescens TaxID=6454 RepID=UPI00201F564D|nr:folylpolyglutamate synthase, mitochondrial-like isoform X1 [Haliotis rufescens]
MTACFHVLRRFTVMPSRKSSRASMVKTIAIRCVWQDAIQTLNTLQSNAETLAKIASTRDSRRHLNIPHMINYLKRCDIEVPDLEKLSVIHISGTKGKGSTSAFCESILRHHGYKTGMFSSPHLVTVNERFRLNGRPVAKDLFSQYFWEVYNKLEATKYQVKGDPDAREMPAYFSFLTVMACHMFLEEDVDVAIFEVGIGGEYDSTNFLQAPVVCGVTSLGLDHTSVLGDTIDKIAWQKAGIFKRNVPAVTVPQPAAAMNVLLNRTKEKGASLYVTPSLDSYTSGREPVHLGIAGNMQQFNATLAMQLCRIWMDNHKKDLSKRKWICDQSELHEWEKIPKLDSTVLTEEMRNGLSKCYWPGRNQILSRPGVTYYMDGAHTIESIQQQCMEWFQQASKKEASKHKGRVCRILVFNATRDRNSTALLSILKPLNFDAAVFCPNLAFTGNVGNAPDQINRTVTKEKQLNYSLVNKEIWDHINAHSKDVPPASSHNSTSDNPELIDSALHNGALNSDQIDLNSNNCNSKDLPSEGSAESHAFPCILQALFWAGQGRDTTVKLPADVDIPPVSDKLQGSAHIQILVTGSMHLVGGALGLLNPELW